MFGFTKLSPEEKALRDKQIRITELKRLIIEEQAIREKSLAKSMELTKELEGLEGQ